MKHEYPCQVKVADLIIHDDGTNVTDLARSLNEVGQTCSIQIDPENRVISGHRRARAAILAGFESLNATTVDSEAGYPEMASAQENLVRTSGDSCTKALEYFKWQRGYHKRYPGASTKGGDRGNQYTGGKNSQNDIMTFSQYAAAMTGESKKTIQRIIKLKNVESLIKQLQPSGNEIGLKDLSNLSDVDPPVQSLAVTLFKQSHGSNLSQSISEAQRLIYLDTHRSAPLEGQDYQLLTGDIAKTGRSLLHDSVDAIITDIPWTKEYFPAVKALATVAKRVLKEGCPLVMMVGGENLPAHLNMFAEHLTYFWTSSYILGGPSTYIKHKNISSRHREIIVFSKGKLVLNHQIADVYQGKGKDKKFDQWGQDVALFETLVQQFTKPGETILEPFCGGGTTVIAALKHHRKVIGIDINSKIIEMTRKRVHQYLETSKAAQASRQQAA